ncbi:MAG: DNA mismatch repair endonuclease MutH [Legionella sp.]|nr:DNA mismatch repair endonuclease MutH [Legionella sp.]
MVISLHLQTVPKTKAELIQRCLQMEGYSFAQLSQAIGVLIPAESNQRKGWVGQAIERFLGADASNQAKPDFQFLNIELKTIPLGQAGRPAESTFITSIPLLTIHQETWKSSQCYSKLKQILWIPVEGDRDIPYQHRRIGRGLLWSPSASQESVLEEDWNYLTLLISTGQLESLDARTGEYLQVRPKAANGKALCYGFDIQGNKIKTLPRGFYLRSNFTAQIISSYT